MGRQSSAKTKYICSSKGAQSQALSIKDYLKAATRNVSLTTHWDGHLVYYEWPLLLKRPESRGDSLPSQSGCLRETVVRPLYSALDVTHFTSLRDFS